MQEMIFCTDCLKEIPEDELYFEAKNPRGSDVILCRHCFYRSNHISDEIKGEFAEEEEKEKSLNIEYEEKEDIDDP